jgi:hypothetical protein
MWTDRFGAYLIRLYLSWVLIAISGIAIVLASVALWLDMDDLYETNEHALLLVLPVAGYLSGWVRGALR